MSERQHYTFGDSDVAAERLRTLARVFEPSSSRLLATIHDPQGTLGVDLGCGLGYTTELLLRHTGVARVVGLDRSERLLQCAVAERQSQRVSFAACDVARPPFPVPPASLLYARFLLTHLSDPAQIVESWASSALPGARLVLEETAFMNGEHPAFPRYYALVERMQAHYGQRMYIGRELEAISATPGWRVESAEICSAPLPAADMARLHFLNLQTWSSDPFARANYAPAELAELASVLGCISRGEQEAAPVTCGIGQVVLRRC